MAKEANLKIYGEIGSLRCNGTTIAHNISDFEKQGYENLLIRVHSPGGSVFEGFNIFNSIRQTRMKVKMVIDGFAASMASIIILAAKDVEIAANGFIMIHRPTAYDCGDVDSHENTAKLLKQIEVLFLNEYSSRTGLSKEEIKSKWLNGKDNWIDAEEALRLKLVSKIIPASAKDVQMRKEQVISMGKEHAFRRFAASLEAFSTVDQTKDWEWYQMNNPRALERMAIDNPELFKTLYKAEFGCYPDLE